MDDKIQSLKEQHSEELYRTTEDFKVKLEK